MYHEILLALVGFPGDVIVQRETRRKDAGGRGYPTTTTTTTTTTFVCSDADGLVPLAERRAIDQVVFLGAHFAAIDAFVQRNTLLSFSLGSTTMSTSLTPSSSQRGLYVRAVCAGLAEVLTAYRRKVRVAMQYHAISCYALYLVRRHVTPFCVTPERIHKSHFGSLCNVTRQIVRVEQQLL
jgi:gamma-tubulin complex component 4